MKTFLFLLFLSPLCFAEPFLVGVVDTGIEQSHPLLSDKIQIFDELKQVQTENIQSIEDMSGHGTHVSGILVKSLKNTKIKIVPFKNMDGEYSKETDKNVKKDLGIPNIIDFAIEHNIKVLNFSQTFAYNEEIYKAFVKAKEKGILIVVAAGNYRLDLSALERGYDLHKKQNPEDTSPMVNSYPCAFKLSNVVCVGNYLKVGKKEVIRVPESNYGNTIVDVMASGENISSSCLVHSVCKMSGSSMSTPRITAKLIKIWDKNKSLSPEKVIEKLISSLPKDKGLKKLTKNGAFLD